ncbi:MAG: peptidase S41 [Thermosipho sp. (in: Bacteria)]|nr:peptidase S41 [Thermosipho sp. (in: thermotogales)]
MSGAKIRKFLLFIFLTLTIFSSLTFAGKIEVAKLQRDFDFLVTLLKEAYIDPDGLVKKPEFTEIVEDIRKKLDKPMDKLEFFKTVAPLFHYLNDYHCSIVFPFSNDNLVFPFSPYVIDGDIYVVFSLIDDVPVKSKILKIDGIPSEEVIKEFEKYVNIKDNNDLRERFLSRYLALIPTFWDKKSVEIEFEYNGLKKKEKVEALVQEEYLRRFEEKNINSSKLPFEFERRGNVGIMRIWSFGIRGTLFTDFREFLKEIFEKNRDMTDLIIDIRRNPGGTLDNGAEVLGHLVKKELYIKFKERIRNSKYNIKALESAGVRYDESTKGEVIEKNSALIVKPRVPAFEGKVWLLIDSRISSAAIVFTAIVQNNKLGKVIGQRPVYSMNTTLGGNGFMQYLPAVKLYAYIPGSYMYFPEYQEITLDYEITMTKEEKLEWITGNSDPMLEKVLKLIEENKD